MPGDSRFRTGGLMLPSFNGGVRGLIIANIAVYLVDFFGSMAAGGPIFRSLVLMPQAVIHGAVWQLFTYLFLHSLGSFSHILFNMLSLWMFGSAVEQSWGTRRFLQYYFICGIGAGVCVVAANMLFGDPYQRVIGASGAIYGLLLAFGMMFPNQTVMMSFLFPIKAKYMVMIFGAIAFLSSFEGGGTVSNLAHLGGMLFGFIYMKTQFGARRTPQYGGSYPRSYAGSASGGPGLMTRARHIWNDYKMQRARKKFKVYMSKQDDGRGPWVN